MWIRQRASRTFLFLAMAVVLMASAPAVLWAVGRISNGDDSIIAKRVAAPLSADRRIERDRYLARRLGLGFGVPPQARAMAVARMRRMRAAQSLSAVPARPPVSSSAIGAEP
jgi:hypothetical protein